MPSASREVVAGKFVSTATGVGIAPISRIGTVLTRIQMIRLPIECHTAGISILVPTAPSSFLRIDHKHNLIAGHALR